MKPGDLVEIYPEFLGAPRRARATRARPGDLVEIYPEFLDESPGEGEPAIGIIVRESTWEDGYQFKRTPAWEEKWWVVMRGGKLVHHPRDTFRIIE